ncbi:MAG: membrane protein [Candidatus Methanofastidiosia archaeon]|jgi:uncharacterized membrane protein YczE
MDKFYLENRDPLAYIQIIIGLFVFATGIVFLLKSNLGMGPWSVFHVGITHHVPLTLGRVSQTVGFLIIVGSLFLDIYPGIGTILNMVLIGFFIDLINLHVPYMEVLPFQILVLGSGIILMGLGSGLYINSNLGAGPRDGLMLGLHKKTQKSIRLIRNSMEITVLVIGFFLGGPVGIGTVAFALAIGPVVQYFLKVIPKRGNEPE